ncbi:class I SAM-dependent methyltransferase [Desulfolutivibrio sulfoxidireducens]|uniref:class I SAM-dependent methyltransferase n=1 Tax=Desulfolutivibrio sulfoxidireducens TaxID=2773299 RepID=UPI00159D444F|nr:class I SAM-dependent methyltransferase [Desulfolutivibrio sulfoxidireducens]QLA17290.1 methyltransferase domain-containing protein [Desulfolutivibrio sulfoxidireducens]
MQPPRAPQPPHDLAIQFGGGDFRKVGKDLVSLCVAHGGLRPDAAVLDVGCGAGRIAVALCDYLDASGRYEGFDVYPPGVEWCQRAITPLFPRFRFQLVDVYNRLYYPFGSVRASEFVFPYPDDSFDFAVLNSVFTHMRPADVENYLKQVHRVLRPGGGCLITFFLLNEQTRERIAAGAAKWRFEHAFGVFHTHSLEDPEEVVAYDEAFIRKLFAQKGFDISRQIYGNWRGIRSGTHQDMVFAVRRPGTSSPEAG